MSKDNTEKGIVKFRGKLLMLFVINLKLMKKPSALLIANEHRNAYGLRYSDFSRYRYQDSTSADIEAKCSH